MGSPLAWQHFKVVMRRKCLEISHIWLSSTSTGLCQFFLGEHYGVDYQIKVCSIKIFYLQPAKQMPAMMCKLHCQHIYGVGAKGPPDAYVFASLIWSLIFSTFISVENEMNMFVNLLNTSFHSRPYKKVSLSSIDKLSSLLDDRDSVTRALTRRK